ncbi:DUF1905 domain-containing protein [Xylanimonas protaetiae]|uniref:DUF1905 domain-containing protein n=1 Tax=Xylanimonas protaetiae TaxID=2509457 RepID=A0A4P6F9Z7_9MICO|nr:DUF1905 domain-containing protein [Xylanimonas protaetiae]QAY70207.1 DUF1905 domain-containing protein [Xylanimonas protaetiae]
MQLKFCAQLWQWQSRTDAWWFVTVPPELSDELAELPLPPRGFGSIRARVAIGGTRWETSVFPSDEQKGYVLPVKKAVRKAEGIEDGATVEVVLEPVC